MPGETAAQQEQRRRRFREFKEEKPVSHQAFHSQMLILSQAERWQSFAGSFFHQRGFTGGWTIVQNSLQCTPQAGLHARVLRGHGGRALFPLAAGVSSAAAPTILCTAV